MLNEAKIITSRDVPASNDAPLHTLLPFINIYLPPLLLIGCVLAGWEVLVHALSLPHWLLPPPSRIAATLIEDLPLIQKHATTTLLETIPGFLLSLAVSFILSIAIDASSLLRRALYPLLVASQTVPIVAVAPLLVIVFGFGFLPKVIVVALVTFFPIVVNTVDGLRSADESMVNLFRAMNASHWQTLRLLRVPAALPYILSGMKVAVTYSVIGAVLAEWIGASSGIGVYIARSLRSFRTDQVFVAIVVTSLLTIVLFLCIAVLERWLTPWKKEETV